ncbi:hypothetical protein, partial [Pseudomonas aeruginosa]|uniref:hypothetical protein n=1 Tax=Pseudomonas aeruginosa TaxID=287 RepID=UPI0034583B8E
HGERQEVVRYRCSSALSAQWNTLDKVSDQPAPFVESVWKFYSSIGFDTSRDIARAVILSMSLSCLAHALIILTTYITNGGLPKVLRGHEQYLFLRALFYLGLCILGIGAMGDNISARRASSFSKELSILLGASILGGVVWTVSD